MESESRFLGEVKLAATYFRGFRKGLCNQADNHCLVYSIQPVACQGYPHTDRKKFVQILELTAINAAMCPIALRVLEGMEVEFPAS
jgi:hypothetical protein